MMHPYLKYDRKKLLSSFVNVTTPEQACLEKIATVTILIKISSTLYRKVFTNFYLENVTEKCTIKSAHFQSSPQIGDPC